ncbi:MAG: phosphoglycolate phosphatase [Candidatus Methanodesulfokora sp.]|nr:MAG: phosphoglycolate phosphatase [Candidatus Korarchaeota archaeon]
MYKAIAVDVDGTITYREPVLHPEAVRHIIKLSKRIKVMLATGNAFPVAYGLSGYLNARGPLIAENGGVVYYGGNIHIMGDPELPQKALEYLRSIGVQFSESISNKFRLVDRVIMTKSREEVESNISHMRVKLIDSGFALHIVPEGVNKGTGLLKACELLGISPNEVISIGDSMTDFEMLKLSGYSIAMPNSPEKLKDIADFIPSGRGYGPSFVLAIKFIEERLL